MIDYVVEWGLENDFLDELINLNLKNNDSLIIKNVLSSYYFFLIIIIVVSEG